MAVNLTTVALAAAQFLGVLDSGEGLSSQQISDALAAANNMLDNWNSDSLFAIATAQALFDCAAGTVAYSIGPSQTINVPTRPISIQAASFFNPSGSGGPVKVLTVKEWAALEDRQSQSNRIQALFYDRGFPTGFVYLFPTPLTVNPSVLLELLVPLTQFADATTPIAILPGYLRILELGLAIELAPQYSMSPSADLSALFADAAGRIRSLNASLLGEVPPEAVQAKQG